MKTKFLWGLLVVLCTMSLTAQDKKNKYTEAGKALEKNFLTMLEDANPNVIKVKDKDLPCEPLLVLQQFTKADLLPATKSFEGYFKMVLEDYGKKLNGLQDNIILETSSDPNLSYLAAVNRSKRFKDFAEDVTGKKIFNINKKDKEVLLDFFLNHPFKKPLSVTAKGKKVASAKISQCYASTEHTLTPGKWKYPTINWTIKTTVTITCDCEDENSPEELNEAVFVYDANIKGSLTTKKIDFGKTRASNVALKHLSCCDAHLEPDEEDPQTDHEEPTEEPNPGQTLPASLPHQTIGVSGGIGFEQDLEEVAICLGAEYLYNITDLGDSPLFIGANAQFSTTSFMDFSNTWIQVGPTVQLFTPINPSQDLHWTNGLEGGYIFGTNDNNGFKDDISGFAVTLVTGLNIQLTNNLAVSLIVPVVAHQNITLESQNGGGSVDISDTSILLNKQNPLKVGLRFGF